MKTKITTTFFAVAAVATCLSQQPLFAQACKDEEEIVGFYEKEISDLQQAVKKETLADFENAYHQKACLTKLTLFVSVLDGLIGCLDKAVQDTTAAKEQVDTYKAKRESAAKLRDKVDHYRSALKAAASSKEAKALIEKIQLAES